MADTILNRFTIGAGKIITTDHTGPASYTTGGEVLGAINNQTGMTAVGLGSLDMVLGSGNFSVSGNYQVFAQQTGTGVRKTFNLLWFSASAAGAGGVASVTITAGGTYTSPAVPTVTFGAPPSGVTATGVAVMATGGTSVAAVLITNPGSGYVTAPSVTFGSGGATGTAVLGSSGPGGQVASATNLSAETVRLGYMGR